VVKITLDQQIAAAQAAAAYMARRVEDPGHLQAAAGTLVWLRDNQAALRQIAGELASVKNDPAVKRALATWPGATIVAVRDL